MANTYKEGKALLDLAKSKNLRIWGAPAVVNSPQFAFMSKTIQEGKLGRVSSAHGQYGHTGPTWSAFFYEKGGGSMPDLGVYNMATLTGLLGPAKSVMAMTSIVNPERMVDDKGKVKVMAEDNAHILLEHDKNIISHGFRYGNYGLVRRSDADLGCSGCLYGRQHHWQRSQGFGPVDICYHVNSPCVARYFQSEKK